MRNESGETELDTVTGRGALDYIASYPGPAIFHLKDFHEPLRDSAEIRRRLRDIHAACLDKQKYVVITSPVRFIPDEVARSITFVELRPPDTVELVDFLRDELRRIGQTEELSERSFGTTGARAARTHD